MEHYKPIPPPLKRKKTYLEIKYTVKFFDVQSFKPVLKLYPMSKFVTDMKDPSSQWPVVIVKNNNTIYKVFTHHNLISDCYVSDYIISLLQ